MIIKHCWIQRISFVSIRFKNCSRFYRKSAQRLYLIGILKGLMTNKSCATIVFSFGTDKPVVKRTRQLHADLSMFTASLTEDERRLEKYRVPLT